MYTVQYGIFFCSLVDLKFHADWTNPSNLLDNRVFLLLCLSVLSSGLERKALFEAAFVCFKK